MRAAAPLALVLMASSAHALVLCTTPDGKTYAGDMPPPGCVATKTFGGATTPGAAIAPTTKDSSSYDPPGVDPESDAAGEIRAINVCRKGVLQNLKAPSSARFQEPLTTQHLGGWNYTVSGEVDTQNPLGVMLRIRFTCDAHYTGGDQWSMKIQFPGQETARPSGPNEAPPGYYWRDNVTCQDLSVDSVNTERFESIGRQTAKGTLLHTGRDPVKNVQVCAGGACEVVRGGSVMRKGDRADFYLSIPNLDSFVVSTDCSVLQKR